MATGSRIFQWGDFSSFSTLTVGTTPLDGDIANVLMGSIYTKWYYDGGLAVWRINDSFITTSSVLNANTQLSGMLNGDFATATDTGQKAVWNGVSSTYNVLA